MDDPSDDVAQREVAQWAGLPVRAMIAPPTDIRSAIRVYYGVGKDTASLSEAVAEVDAETAAGVRSHDRAKSVPPRLAEDVPASSERTPVPGTLHVLSPVKRRRLPWPRSSRPRWWLNRIAPLVEPPAAASAPAPIAEPMPAALPAVEITPRIVPSGPGAWKRPSRSAPARRLR